MAIKRQRKREQVEAKLEMTPMIDVVFQLLVFFVLTIKQEPIFAQLDVSRPAPDPEARKEEPPDDMINITIFNNPKSVVLQNTPVNFVVLEKKLAQLASYSQTQTVLIKCMGDSHHQTLVKVLDICAKVKLKNLSVFSLGDKTGAKGG